MRRGLVVAAALAFAAVILITATGAAARVSRAHGLTTVTVAIAPFQDVNSINVGIQKGFFAKNGLQLRVLHTTWPNGNLAVIGGKADLGGFADAEVATADAQGDGITMAIPLFQFAGGAYMYDPKKFPQWHNFDYFLKHTHGKVIPALRETLVQMEGKKIGMEIPGGEYTALIEECHLTGLDFKKFHLLNIVQANEPPALFAGSIDLMAGGIPQRLTALNHGYLALFADTVLPSTVQSDGFGAKLSWAKTHLSTLVAFQRAIFQTQQYILAHPTEAFQIIAKNMQQQGTAEDPKQLPLVWNHMEFFPSSKTEYMKDIASPTGRFYWKSRYQSVINDLYSSKSIKPGSLKNVTLSDMYYALKVVQGV